MNIGKSIKVLRIAKGINQRELAQQMGMSANYISMIENNIREPSVSFLKKISSTFNVPMNLFLLEIDLDKYTSQQQNLIFKINELILQLESEKIKSG